jgi:hypothetical protein
MDSAKNPLKAALVTLRGIRTKGPMKPDIPLDRQRPANFVFSAHVESKLAEIRASRPPRPPHPPLAVE